MVSTSFTMCNQFSRNDCVIDGDTFYLRGQRVRIADIDAPEAHPARCEYEQRLGEQATRRLLDLLNAGPFSLETWEERDEDAYGRKLRTVVREGNSLGSVLVSEGLVRGWTGRRLPWCD
jgi:micrococcal nuclease